MSASHSAQFFWSDWLGDQAVRRLTPAERGVWIDLLALAAVASPVGYVCDDRGNPLSIQEIARVSNAGSPEDVAKLITGILEKGAASRDRTGRLFNRRMVRDATIAAKRKRSGKAGGEATRLKWEALSGLPEPNARHSLGPHVRDPYRLERVTPFFSKAAREEKEQTNPAGGFASAACGAALARQPGTEQAASEPPAKRIDELSAAEIIEMRAKSGARA